MRPEGKGKFSGPFSKAVSKVTDEEFEQAKTCPDHVVITESALGGAEVALAFRPRQEWPKSFRFYRLYR
jgi:hypothetical protein